jgi:hypothetical protein
MNNWENKPLYVNPELRRKYYRKAARCKVLDSERMFIFKYQRHLSYMMDEYHDISRRLEVLWQQNIDSYDEANKTYTKTRDK